MLGHHHMNELRTSKSQLTQHSHPYVMTKTVVLSDERHTAASIALSKPARPGAYVQCALTESGSTKGARDSNALKPSHSMAPQYMSILEAVWMFKTLPPTLHRSSPQALWMAAVCGRYEDVQVILRESACRAHSLSTTTQWLSLGLVCTAKHLLTPHCRVTWPYPEIRLPMHYLRATDTTCTELITPRTYMQVFTSQYVLKGLLVIVNITASSI